MKAEETKALGSSNSASLPKTLQGGGDFKTRRRTRFTAFESKTKVTRQCVLTWLRLLLRRRQQRAALAAEEANTVLKLMGALELILKAE